MNRASYSSPQLFNTMAERGEVQRSPYKKDYNKRHSYPLVSKSDHDYRDFLYLVDCGTLHLPEEHTRLLRYSHPIQEMGDNIEAKKTAMKEETELDIVLAEMVADKRDIIVRRPDIEENLEVKPVMGPLTKLSVEESSINTHGSLLVVGTLR